MNKKKKKWTMLTAGKIYKQAFNDLIAKAQGIHRRYHIPNQVQLASILNIKTGACPEDCGYCSQSGHYETPVQREKIMPLQQIIDAAREAKKTGATRFCIGAAWRNPPQKQIAFLQEIIRALKALGMETCMTLGMLTEADAAALKEAGLDYYNHNLDTSPSYYPKIVRTRSYADRLATLEAVRNAGIKICCGGILGLGESQNDRIEFLVTLANLPKPPESLPINRLIPIPGTPLADAAPLDGLELVRTIATARIMMPESVIRLTAGRTAMSDELQALCFFAGASSIFIGNKLLTEDNPQVEKDRSLFAQLGIETLS